MRSDVILTIFAWNFRGYANVLKVEHVETFLQIWIKSLHYSVSLFFYSLTLSGIFVSNN